MGWFDQIINAGGIQKIVKRESYLWSLIFLTLRHFKESAKNDHKLCPKLGFCATMATLSVDKCCHHILDDRLTRIWDITQQTVTCKLHISQEFFKGERTILNVVFSVTDFICLAQQYLQTALVMSPILNVNSEYFSFFVNLLGIIDLQCCNNCQLLDDFTQIFLMHPLLIGYETCNQCEMISKFDCAHS